MNSLDTRLRETFERVAESTRVNRRVDEIVRHARRRRLPRFTIAIATFAVVTAAFGLPMLLGGSPTDAAGGGGVTAPQETVSSPVTVPASTTLPQINGASAIAARLGASALAVDELKSITGMEADMAYSGYLIDSTTTSDSAYELGLTVYESHMPNQDPITCFTTYAFAIDEGVNVAGSTVCGFDAAGTERIASFEVSIGGSCGGIPKEEPVVDGVWTLLTVWGIPEVADTVTVELADGSKVDVAADNGVAHQLWDSSVGIENIEFDGMSPQQRDRIASYMPAPGIDC